MMMMQCRQCEKFILQIDNERAEKYEAFDVLDIEFKEVKNQLADETASHQTTRTLLAQEKEFSMSQQESIRQNAIASLLAPPKSNSKRDMKKGRVLNAAHDVKESVPLPATLLTQSSLEQVSIDSEVASLLAPPKSNSKKDMKKGRVLNAAHDVKESVPLPATLLSQSSLEQVSIDSKEADGHCRENRSEFDSRFMGMLLTIQADFSAKLAAQKEEFQADFSAKLAAQKEEFQADFSAKLAAQKVVSAAQKEELVAQISQLNNRVVSLELTIRPIFLRKLATNARELVWKEAGRDPLYPFTYIEFCTLNASDFTSKGSKYYDDVVKPLKELKLVIDAGNTIAHQIAPSDAQLCADELTSMPEGVHRAVLELFYMHFFGHSANEQLVQGAR